MPLISLFFTSKPARNATSARMSDALSTPWPPSPATTTLISRSRMRVLSFVCSRLALFQFAQPFDDENARPAGDDDAQFPAREAFIQHALEFIRTDARLDHMHPLHAQRTGQVFEHKSVGRLVVQLPAGAGMFLWPVMAVVALSRMMSTCPFGGGL